MAVAVWARARAGVSFLSLNKRISQVTWAWREVPGSSTSQVPQ